MLPASAEGHDVLYADPRLYCGWPANHGAWQWGDEFLVGFIAGRWQRKSMHNIDADTMRKVQARSLDGGRTWTVEDPGVDFECIDPGPADRAYDTTRDILRVCGVYDHGGDVCHEGGGYYLSANRGKTWAGPFAFAGLEQRRGGDLICTSRTAVLGNLIFLSNGQRDVWGTDATFCAEIENDGDRMGFRFRGTVCEDDARAVMPGVAEVSGRIVVTLRRRKSGVRAGWIDAFGSDDQGATWRKLAFVGDTGSHNGNPSALLALPDGRLICTFANRDFGSMVCAISDDRGESWSAKLFREGGKSDIGYPRLFLRSDGTPVCVYYWADKDMPAQHIAVTEVYVQ